MSDFIRKIDKKPSFAKENYFKGFSFLKENNQIDLDYIDMTYGHDWYQIDTEATHIYYILNGSGEAKIAGERYTLETGLVVEIPKIQNGHLKVILKCWRFQFQNSIQKLVSIQKRMTYRS